MNESVAVSSDGTRLDVNLDDIYELIENNFSATPRGVTITKI